ncbi:MAG TPA: hypothetical protein DEQ30_07795 [Porphyromonadaceae bacterium]|nr:hypothetical protein [Porphyromonadaceae bacterium]
MNILTCIKFTFYSLGILFITSCSEDNDAYTPLSASTKITGLLVSIESVKNESLLSDKDFIGNIYIVGDQSNKPILFTVKKIVDGSDEKDFISFNAEIPDVRNFKFKSTFEADGQSIITLNINKQELKLQCHFRYICTDPETYGNNSITLEKIEYNGRSVIRENNLINSDIVLSLDENIFSLR